jgi:hypothetical protein
MLPRDVRSHAARITAGAPSAGARATCERVPWRDHWGSPSTCSATMLRLISDVPPAIPPTVPERLGASEIHRQARQLLVAVRPGRLGQGPP